MYFDGDPRKANRWACPGQEFPNLVESARDMANVWLSNPNSWWRESLDLIVFGLEAMLHKRRSR